MISHLFAECRDDSRGAGKRYGRVYALAADGSGSAVQWTVPNHYTGGDADPLPLRDGALIYTGEAFQLWTVPAVAAASPPAARAITQNLGLDSSPPAWVS